MTGAGPEGSLLGQDLGSLELVGNFRLPQELVGEFRSPQNFGLLLLLLAGHFDLDLHLELAAIFEQAWFESRVL